MARLDMDKSYHMPKAFINSTVQGCFEAVSAEHLGWGARLYASRYRGLGNTILAK